MRRDISKNMVNADVIVIGAGAAGLTAAISASKRTSRVLVLNHHPVAGKKILSTGNGKCNLTNEYQDISCYRSDDPEKVSRVLACFGLADAIRFFCDMGISLRSKNGYYYPSGGQAATVREALIAEARHFGAEIINEADIASVGKSADGFAVDTGDAVYHGRSLILATGGKAAPDTGSDGSGYAYAAAFGHSLISPLPALVPLISMDRWLKNVAGVRADAKVTLMVDGAEVAEDTGELQLNASQVSGIPVFQISRYASIALMERKKVEVAIDFVTDIDEDELARRLISLAESLGEYKSWKEILSGMVHSKIAGMICDRLKLSPEPVMLKYADHISVHAYRISAHLKHTVALITGTGYMSRAQATCGGIPLQEVEENMESKIVPGLYFAGEILNVDGICGGYNLQWAWSSGYIAGKSAADRGLQI